MRRFGVDEARANKAAANSLALFTQLKYDNEQLDKLKEFIHPFSIFFREAYRFCCFTLVILKNNNFELNKEFASYKTIRKYAQSRTMTDFMQQSSLNISIKTLNPFLEKFHSESKHAKYIYIFNIEILIDFDIT
jgi:hypothetical protein